MGPRLARSIPRSPLARVAAFLFYSGSAGGVLWCLILMLATVILPFVVNAGLTPRSYGYSYSRNIFMEIMTVVAGIGLYTICYSLTAVHIRRAWLSRWIKPKFTWALVLLIFAVLIIVPLLIHLLLFREGFYRMDDSGLFLGTPFLLGSRDMQGASLAFSGLWAIVMGIAALPWLVRQMERFRPLRPTPAPASPPPVAQATVVNPDE